MEVGPKAKWWRDTTTVIVSIKDDLGNVLDSGNAVEQSGRWLFTAKKTLSATVLHVTAVATDRPGGTSTKTETVRY